MTSAMPLQFSTKCATNSTESCSLCSILVEDNKTWSEVNMNTSYALKCYTYLLLTKFEACTGRTLACPKLLTVSAECCKVCTKKTEG